MKFKGDIIITDPCYIFRDEDWDKYCEDFNDSFIKELGFTNYIWESTIYGDWSCTTINKDTNEKIGRFCADAGLVGVFLKDEVDKYNPNFLKDYSSHTRTIIKDFDGDIQYIVQELENNNTEEDEDYYEEEEAQIHGKGNINFFTTQTAF